MVAHLLSAGQPPVKVSTPPQLSWCAITAPADLRYTGTSVQAVHAALSKAFVTRTSGWPLKLTAEHLPVLQGMAAAAGGGSEPYDLLYAALERFGEIEVRDK